MPAEAPQPNPTPEQQPSPRGPEAALAARGLHRMRELRGKAGAKVRASAQAKAEDWLNRAATKLAEPKSPLGENADTEAGPNIEAPASAGAETVAVSEAKPGSKTVRRAVAQTSGGGVKRVIDFYTDQNRSTERKVTLSAAGVLGAIAVTGAIKHREKIAKVATETGKKVSEKSKKAASQTKKIVGDHKVAAGVVAGGVGLGAYANREHLKGAAEKVADKVAEKAGPAAKKAAPHVARARVHAKKGMDKASEFWNDEEHSVRNRLLVGGAVLTAAGVGYKLHERRSRTAPAAEAEPTHAEVMDAIDKFNAKLENKNYVPTVDEFKKMQEYSELVNITEKPAGMSDEEWRGTPITYSIKTAAKPGETPVARQLSPAMTRAAIQFKYNLNKDKWGLTSDTATAGNDDIDFARRRINSMGITELRAHSVEPAIPTRFMGGVRPKDIKKHPAKNRHANDLRTFAAFEREAAPGLTNDQLVRAYKGHVARRLALHSYLFGDTAMPSRDQGFITDALRDFVSESERGRNARPGIHRRTTTRVVNGARRADRFIRRR